MSKSIEQLEHLKRIRKKIDYKKVGRKKNGKNKSTLLREQAEKDLRALMLEKITPEWVSLMERLIAKAKTDTDVKALTYIINQGAGRAKETKEIDISAERLDKLSESIKKILDK